MPAKLGQSLILRRCCSLLIFRKIEERCRLEMLWALLHCTLLVSSVVFFLEKIVL